MSGYALITGASSGIGEEFALQLASQGYNLILVARRTSLLETIAQKIKDKYDLEVIVITADLSILEEVEMVIQRIQDINQVSYLVNNAGFASVGEIDEVDWIKHQSMINLHISASTRLIHAILPQMKESNVGVIINVSSISAFTASGVYSATKSYLVTLSRGLKKSLKDYNIVVQALCPGFTYSDFHKTDEFKAANLDIYSRVPKFAWLSSKKVVEISLKGVKKKKIVVIPSWRHKLTLRIAQLGIVNRSKYKEKDKTIINQ
ncbi:MAG: SDR family NAD(P)-dependent oxidoreductase [Candidatus Heimdallarchaeota archaeon]|nr:SDR family NAD(P)-dependent oxidoreductase [Candidatus Heimdallarchaeota archaeon]